LKAIEQKLTNNKVNKILDMITFNSSPFSGCDFNQGEQIRLFEKVLIVGLMRT
jgi:hypothetical protein